MAKAKLGDTVKVHYTGKFEDGSIFDSSINGNPLEFTLGLGHVIPGFDNAVIGMEPDEKKSFKVEPEEGYGNYSNDLAFEIDKSRIPDDLKPEIGMDIVITNETGEKTNFTIIDVKEDSIIIDANHPLAGQILNFDIQLMDIL
jgi:peptidylprolyl isomerase